MPRLRAERSALTALDPSPQTPFATAGSLLQKTLPPVMEPTLFGVQTYFGFSLGNENDRVAACIAGS